MLPPVPASHCPWSCTIPVLCCDCIVCQPSRGSHYLWPVTMCGSNECHYCLRRLVGVSIGVHYKCSVCICGLTQHKATLTISLILSPWTVYECFLMYNYRLRFIESGQPLCHSFVLLLNCPLIHSLISILICSLRTTTVDIIS